MCVLYVISVSCLCFIRYFQLHNLVHFLYKAIHLTAAVRKPAHLKQLFNKELFKRRCQEQMASSVLDIDTGTVRENITEVIEFLMKGPVIVYL